MSSKAKTTARRLLRENRKNGRSWRVIAREDFGGQIPAGTLCRFAINKGEWIPKSEELQIALGIKTPRKPKPPKNLDLFDLPTPELLRRLVDRQEMPPVQPRVFRAFQKAGFFKRARRSTA